MIKLHPITSKSRRRDLRTSLLMGNSLQGQQQASDPAPWPTELVNAFTSLVAKAKSKSSETISDPSVLVDYISGLPISKSSHQSTPSASLVPKLKEAQTLDDVFDVIQPLIRFNQCDLLKCLVDKFGEEETKRELEEYSSSVEKFNRETTVDELVELMTNQQINWTDQEREKAEQEGCTIKMILDDKYGRNNLDRLQKDVALIFNCENYVLALAAAKKGSIELVWYTGLGAIQHLTNSALGNMELLNQIGVIELRVGPNSIDVDASEMPPSGNDTDEVDTDGGYGGNTISQEPGVLLNLFQNIAGFMKSGNLEETSKLLHNPQLPLDHLGELLQMIDEEGSSLLHIAVTVNNLEMVKVVLTAIDKRNEESLKWLWNSRGESPLHIAFHIDSIDIIKALLEFPKAAVIPSNHSNLLQIATSDPSPNSVIKLKLIMEHSNGNPLNLYPDFRQHFPAVRFPKVELESTIPVIVVGDSNAGKSTLIKSLQIEGVKSQFFHLFFNVSNVSAHKAGIIPTPFQSAWFGNVVFYDLSSHREFVHEAILHCGHLTDAVFIVVVNLHDKTDDITKQLVYWLKFVKYHYNKACGRSDRLPNVAIVGSHLYQLRFGKLANRERFLLNAYPRARPYFNEADFNIIARELMDCRKSSVPNTILRLALSHEFKTLRRNRPQLPSQSYILYGMMKDYCNKKKVSFMSVYEILVLLDKEDAHCKMIQPKVMEVLRLCKPLGELNLLLVLENEEELERSWIVIDSHSLLCKVEQAIFTDDTLATNDGILMHDVLLNLFDAMPNIDPEMMIKLMIHYCYCSKLHSTFSPLPSWAKHNRYFFPHLLPEQPISQPTQQKLMFAWTLSPSSPYQYFMPYFIHHFLLQLCQEPEISRENYDRARRTLITSFPAIGLEMVVHVYSNQAIIVSMRTEGSSSSESIINCLQMRNRLVAKIRNVVEELDPEIKSNLSLKEALISGKDERHPVHYPVLQPPKIRGIIHSEIKQRYGIDDVLNAVKNRSMSVRPMNHPEPLSSVEDLLEFEPYFHLSDEVRSAIKDPVNPDDSISDAFLESFTRDLGMERLHLVLSAVGVSSIDNESIREVPEGNFHRKLSRAASFVQGMGLTYDRLRAILDSVSFFKLNELY